MKTENCVYFWLKSTNERNEVKYMKKKTKQNNNNQVFNTEIFNFIITRQMKQIQCKTEKTYPQNIQNYVDFLAEETQTNRQTRKRSLETTHAQNSHNLSILGSC